MTLDEAIEISEVRMVVEGLCAAKAAERAKGLAWGLKTVESVDTHGTPQVG